MQFKFVILNIFAIYLFISSNLFYFHSGNNFDGFWLSQIRQLSSYLLYILKSNHEFLYDKKTQYVSTIYWMILQVINLKPIVVYQKSM